MIYCTLFLNILVPTPTVATGNMNLMVVAGNSAQLSCTVTLPSYSDSVYGAGAGVMVEATWDRGVGSTNKTASSSIVSFSNQLNTISTEDKGVYTCTARVYYTGAHSPVINSNISAGATTTLMVQSNNGY